MNDKELTDAIVAKYKDIYDDWPNPKVTEIVHNAFDGTLAAVRATDTSGKDWEEICHVTREGKITVFSTTEELARHLESRFHSTWWERLLTPTGIAGVLAIILVCSLCLLAISRQSNS